MQSLVCLATSNPVSAFKSILDRCKSPGPRKEEINTLTRLTEQGEVQVENDKGYLKFSHPRFGVILFAPDGTICGWQVYNQNI